MKKICLLIAFALTCMTGLSSCVSACESLKDEAALPVTVYPLTLAGAVDRITNNTVIDIEYTQGADMKAELICPAEYKQYVNILVSKGELLMKLSDDLDSDKRNEVSKKLYHSKLYLTTPELHSITVNGSSKFTANTDLRADELTAVLNGSGDIDFNGVQCSGEKGVLLVQLNGSGDVIFRREVKAQSVDMQLNGSGDIDCAIVTAQSFTSQVNGSGDVDVDNVAAVSVTAQVNGSGDLSAGNVLATSATAEVNGSGDLKLLGQCKEAVFSMVGSGDIYAKDLVAQDVTATVNGSGNINCNAQSTLVAKVIRSGEIHYRGTPKITYLSKPDNVKAIKD